jgi:NodT family efflux transporter outer membrane factor (OMF) lipoprotein
MKRTLFVLLLLSGCVVLYGCAVGPDYKRPEVEVPAAYKGSAAADWKPAEPRDAVPRGMWWKMYGDPELDALMARVDAANQTLAAAEAQVRISAALADQSRAGFWPQITGTIQRTESKPSSTTGPVVGQASNKRTIYSLPLNLSWEIDLWGRIRRLVESGDAATQASASDLVNARLLAQATLAQNYFQLRALDSQKQLLDQTADAYGKSLEMTRNRYNAGVISRLDVVQAETQLNSARAQSLDLGVQRAQLENAVAVLVGTPASGFSLAQGALSGALPLVPPAGLPAELLERRPDVAAAERRVEAANAQIGVAKAAYFPAATLTGTYGWQTAQRALWFTAPSNFWSLGAALALTLFDGGRRAAVTEQAQAGYDQTVANYRGTVLQAFTDVEDNLAALRILEQEAAIQDETVRAAQQALDITLNQYKSGIATYLQVVVTQASLLQAQTTALGVRQRRMAASVLLVKALGGGWE